MTYKQGQLKEQQQHPTKRAEIQTSLQILYEYARGYYLKLLQVREGKPLISHVYECLSRSLGCRSRLQFQNFDL